MKRFIILIFILLLFSSFAFSQPSTTEGTHTRDHLISAKKILFSNVCGFTTASIPFAGGGGCLLEDNTNFFYTNGINLLTISGGIFSGGNITLDDNTDDSPAINFITGNNDTISMWVDDAGVGLADLYIKLAEDTGASEMAITNFSDTLLYRFNSLGNFAVSGNITLGFEAAPATDYPLTFAGESNTGTLRWMEDEDYFRFENEVRVYTISPEFALHNAAAEDGDETRESYIRGKGFQSGGEESTLGMMKFSHDGPANDEKGKVGLYTNSTADGDSPTLALEIDSAQLASFLGNLSLNAGSQNYIFSDRGSALYIQGQSSSATTNVEFFTKDGDTTDNMFFNFWGRGLPASLTHSERLYMGWDTSPDEYFIATAATGTGTLRDLILRTGSNTDQIKLNSDGSVEINHEGPTDDAFENTLTTSNTPDATSDTTVYFHNALNDARNMAAKIHNIMTDPRVLFQATDDPGGGTQEDYSGQGHTGTYTGTWATNDLQWKGAGLVYRADFDGASYIDYGDDTDFTFNDSGDEPVSWSGWIQVTDGGIQIIIAKWDELTATPKREWKVYLDAAEKLGFAIYDETLDEEASALTDAALSVGWHHFSIMYDGGGGNNPLTAGTDMCVDGDCAVAFTITDNATYTNMTDTASKMLIGASENTSSAPEQFFQASMIEVDVTGELYNTDDIFKLRLNTRGDCGE